MRRITCLALMLAATAAPARGEEAPRLLRVLGETTSPVDGAPSRFVIDAEIRPGDADFQSEVSGWLAALSPTPDGDELEGACVEARCALSADLDYGKLALSADLTGIGAPGSGRLSFTESGEDRPREGAVKLTLVKGTIPGLGTLAPPGAVKAAELSELLMWNGEPTGFSNSSDEAVGWLQREALAEWQAGQDRPGAGLILEEDLARLRSETASAKAAAGWRALGDPARGWTAGYPAALLPAASAAGNQQTFTSADGAAVLVVAVDPPLDDFDAFVDRQTEDRPGIERRSYTRVNDDMEINFEERGRVSAAAYHNREGGFVRLEFSYPAEQRETYERFEVILQRSLRVGDEVNP